MNQHSSDAMKLDPWGEAARVRYLNAPHKIVCGINLDEPTAPPAKLITRAKVQGAKNAQQKKRWVIFKNDRPELFVVDLVKCA